MAPGAGCVVLCFLQGLASSI
uniref:Uncharacterized protein n=1 Tax=Rhizophora mucronata TaxID=61149 RepID=A0A2P2NBK5_RHIMU